MFTPDSTVVQRPRLTHLPLQSSTQVAKTLKWTLYAFHQEFQPSSVPIMIVGRLGELPHSKQSMPDSGEFFIGIGDADESGSVTCENRIWVIRSV